MFDLFAPPLGRNAHPYDLSLNCSRISSLKGSVVADDQRPQSLLVIFRLCRSDIFAAQKRYCRFAAAILYSPPKLPVGQYNLRSKYNWRSQYNSPKANIAEKDSDCITIKVFFWQGHKDLICHRFCISSTLVNHLAPFLWVPRTFIPH